MAADLLFKVLVGGRSCNGGSYAYSLPTQQPDGTWLPGEWTPPVAGPLELCDNGYHVTQEPARWWQDSAECFAVEVDGDRLGEDGDDKICVRRCRLTRRLTVAELVKLNVFLDGQHSIATGHAAAAGSASVEARDSARVVARDSARVVARGSARVVARDSARVVAWGSARVVARDSARVVAWDSALIQTPLHAWGQPTVAVRDYAVWVDQRNGLPVVHAVAAEMVMEPEPETVEAADA